MPPPEEPGDPVGAERPPGEEGEEALLRRGFETGRAEHGPLTLPYGTFARRARDLTARRLAGGGAVPPGETAAEALGRAALGDLFLAVACDEGVPGAWERFTARFGRTLVALALRRGASRAEAEEIAREIPGDLFAAPPGGGSRTRLGTFDGSGSLQAWLGVIVGRRVADRRRSAARGSVPVPAGDVDDARPARAASAGADPADLAAESETGHRFAVAFREAWASLTDREALVLLLKYRNLVPQREIARMLGVGEPRVSRTVHAAAGKIRAAVLRSLGPAPAGGSGDPERTWALLERSVSDFLGTLPPSSDSSTDG